MKRLFLGSIAAVVLGLPAGAAAQDAGDWSGIYIAAEAGGASGRLKASGSDSVVQLSNVVVPGRGLVVVPGSTTSNSGTGTDTNFIYGGVLGGQWQTGGVILGLEGDFHGGHDFSGFSTPVAIPATLLAPASSGTISRSARSFYDWSARAKLGVAIGSRGMIYISGGVAGARVRLTGQDTFLTPAGAAPTSGNIAAFVSPTIGPVVLTGAERRNLIGWTAGLGGEIKVARKIGIGLDARYTNYGAHDFSLGGCGTTIIIGTCAGASRTSPPIVIYGTTLNPATDVTPGIIPGSTRMTFSDIRLTGRIVFHF